MVFAAHSFLAFLLILLVGYWLAGRHDERWGKPLLITASFVFYGFWIPAYLLLLIASILFNHAIARAVLAGPEQRIRRALTVSGIVPMFPIYFLIVWFMPNTMELFQACKAALHVEEYRDLEKRPLRPVWLRFDLTARWAITTAGVFIVAWFALSNLSPFIYFQF